MQKEDMHNAKLYYHRSLKIKFISNTKSLIIDRGRITSSLSGTIDSPLGLIF